MFKGHTTQKIRFQINLSQSIVYHKGDFISQKKMFQGKKACAWESEMNVKGGNCLDHRTYNGFYLISI